MSGTARVGPQAKGALALDDPGLAVDVGLEGDVFVVFVRGELDMATCDNVFIAATDGQRPAIVVDLNGVTFMDCAGYGCLDECRLVLEGSGRTLTIGDQTGQPARLLAMIASLEHTNVGVGAAPLVIILAIIFSRSGVIQSRPGSEPWVVGTDDRDHNSPIDYHASAPPKAATDPQPMKPIKEKT